MRVLWSNVLELKVESPEFVDLTPALLSIVLAPLLSFAFSVAKGLLLAFTFMVIWNRILTELADVPSLGFFSSYCLITMVQMLSPVHLSVGKGKN